MNWRPIARKDFLDAARSRSLWGLVVLFVGLLLVIAYLPQTFEETSLTQFVDFTADAFALFVPLVAVVVGYKSIVDERESGTIALLLSFPHTRGDMVVGKYVGRSLVLAIPILIGLLVASLLIVVLYDTFPLLRYLAFAVAAVGLGLAFLAVAIGLSMSTTSSRRVTAGAFGAYVVLGVLWSDLVEAILLILWRFDGEVLASPPDWVLFVQMASPVESFNRLVTALFDTVTGAQYAVDGAPWFVDWWMAVLVLLGWIVLSLGVGYWQFARADL